MIYDPSTSYDVIQEQIPAVQFVDYWGGLFPFNDTLFEPSFPFALSAC